MYQGEGKRPSCPYILISLVPHGSLSRYSPHSDPDPDRQRETHQATAPPLHHGPHSGECASSPSHCHARPLAPLRRAVTPTLALLLFVARPRPASCASSPPHGLVWGQRRAADGEEEEERSQISTEEMGAPVEDKKREGGRSASTPATSAIAIFTPSHATSSASRRISLSPPPCWPRVACSASMSGCSRPSVFASSPPRRCCGTSLPQCRCQASGTSGEVRG
jgi:hypothetical protein